MKDVFRWLALVVSAATAFAPRRAGVSAAEGDADLVRAMAGGDGHALAATYDRYGRLVHSLALRIVGDAAEAEDVVQDVFLQAWQQAGRFEASRGSVPAWLLAMARSRAIDRLRARQSRPEGHRADQDFELAADAGLLPDRHAIDVQHAGRVREALHQLPGLQRVAIELAYFEGLTHAEIAARLEQPLGTVKTRIRTGLLRLRATLAGLA